MCKVQLDALRHKFDRGCQAKLACFWIRIRPFGESSLDFAVFKIAFEIRTRRTVHDNHLPGIFVKCELGNYCESLIT